MDLNDKDRFMKYIQKSDDPDGCWKWVRGKNKYGYGTFTTNNKTFYAHRISYALFVGDVPDNLFVCHTCDNRACVNPAHLWLGTNQDNIIDRNNKNRQSHHTKMRGENQGSHKLTEQKVYQIRELIEQGYSQREIAETFGVSQQTISDIKNGRLWGWLKWI